jgi:hypothetical protein
VTDKIQQALTWATVTGHAGWAGRLVQVTEETSDSIALVYPLRTKTLKLLDEASSILPKHKQWDITFNTFFTKTGEECRWRCYCADVTEAVPFKGGEFDLMKVKKDGLPPVDSPYTEAAINGKKVGASPAAKPSPVAKVRTSIKSDSDRSLEATQSLADKRKAKKEGEDFLATITKDTKQSSVKPTQHSLEVLPRQAGPLPPPVNRAARSIDLLNDVINDGKNSRNRKSQRPDTVKIALLVVVPALVLIIMILVNEITKVDAKKTQPIPDKSAVVGIPKGDANKTDPIVDKTKDDKPKEELLVGKTPDDKAGGTAPAKTTPPVPEKVAETQKTTPPVPEKVAETQKTTPPVPEKVAEIPKTTPPVPEKVAEIPKTAPPVPGKAQEIPKTAPVVKAMVQGTKEAASNVNELTEIVAYKMIEGNLIVPLDTFLKEKSKNKEGFEKIIKEGITVKLPKEIKLEHKIHVNYLDFPAVNKKSLQIDNPKDNSFHIKIPSDLESSDIDICTFAFCKIPVKTSLSVQFFEPLTLDKEIEEFKVKKTSPFIVKAIHFKANTVNSEIKYKKIRDWIGNNAIETQNKSVLATELIYHGFTKNFFFINNEKELAGIIETLYKDKKSEFTVMVNPQGYEVVTETTNKNIVIKGVYDLSFTNFSYYAPVLWTKRADEETNLRKIMSTKRGSDQAAALEKLATDFKKKSDDSYELGNYIFTNKSDRINMELLNKSLSIAIQGFNEDPNKRFNSEFFEFLGMHSSSVKDETIDKIVKQYVDQLKHLQKCIIGENLEFMVSYKTQWNNNIDGRMENKEFYKDAKIVVYTYKQPK